jgi:hypothetical protein
MIDAATGVLSFTSRSPDADRYQVLRSIAGAPAQPVLVTAHTSGLKPPAPLCEPVTFTAVAIDSAVSWTSDPSPSVSYRRQPSATQTCSQAPRIAAAALRRSGSVVAVRVRTTGVGKLAATLVHTGHKLAVVAIDLTRAGHKTLRLHLPAGRPHHGRYVVRLQTTSPDGSRHATTTLTLEIAR